MQLVVYNLNLYKKAKIYKKHLLAIIHTIKLSESALGHFKAYTPVARILAVMTEQRVVLEQHLKSANKIEETKGSSGEPIDKA